MAQRLEELCAVFVGDNFGQVCQQIFRALAEHGRLYRQQLLRLLQLPGRQLRHALTVLTQQHVLRWHTDDDDITRYSIDWRSTYNLLRSNRIISLVDQRYGEGAARIVTNLLQLGHARVGDLAQAFDLEPSLKRDSAFDDCNGRVNGSALPNGTDSTHAHKSQVSKITTSGQFHHMLRTLLQAGFLVKLQKRSYMPAADLLEEIEETVISEHFPDRKVTGPKKQADFRRQVNSLKRKWQDEVEYSERHDAESRGTFRSAAGSKRVKLNGNQPNGIGHGNDGHGESVPKLPNDMVLRVNFAQCTLALRSERLEQLAEPYLGGVTATVYGALLHVLEAKLKGKHEGLTIEDDDEDADDPDDSLPSITTTEVADALEPTLNLGLGFFDESTKKKKLKPNEEFTDLAIKEEVFSDDDEAPNGFSSFHDRSKHISLIDEHLRLLQEHPKTFCRRVGSGNYGEWRVPLSSLTDTLVQAEIDGTILARFGKVHMRFVRLLRERGRLEEKQVASLTMMRVKDVRAILTQLQYAGFVESQEVPRDNTRMAARTAYLWFHDQSRVQNLLLEQTYQGMARTLQRLQHERENYKNAIEKAEMMDTKQDSLNHTEKQAVQQWRELEERLITQVHRMDELVALLRDFSGHDTSLVS